MLLYHHTRAGVYQLQMKYYVYQLCHTYVLPVITVSTISCRAHGCYLGRNYQSFLQSAKVSTIDTHSTSFRVECTTYYIQNPSGWNVCTISTRLLEKQIILCMKQTSVSLQAYNVLLLV